MNTLTESQEQEKSYLEIGELAKKEIKKQTDYRKGKMSNLDIRKSKPFRAEGPLIDERPEPKSKYF